MRVLEPRLFEQLVTRAAAAGLASVVHAIGDAAVSLALDVLGRAERSMLAMPHRIEHVQCCPPERMADAGRHGIVCSVQPSHILSDWQAADRHWGRRARYAYAFRSLAAGSATLAFGSDAPVEPVDPRLALYAAVTRQDCRGEPAGGWYPEQRIDIRSALAAFTRGPAIAAGMEAELGQLAPGMFGDLAVWDRDPLAVPASELLAMRCIATVVGGRLVWRDA
jgi:predicted amidohydrolase YtcJ